MSDRPTPTETNRRRFLRSLGTTSVAGGLATTLGRREIARPVRASDGADASALEFDPDADPDGTFPQSVASGGPTPSGVILWTRVAPDAVVPGTPLGVEVATDPDFRDVVHRSTVAAERVAEAHDYTVKVDLDGRLNADRFYHYRFVYDGVASRPGRCRTLPSPDASPDALSLGVLTCQDYQNGYYGAYHHLAQEDVDFVVHLGDFVYESADGSYASPTEGIAPGRDFDLPDGDGLAESLADFRSLYRRYKGDPLLQEGLERHTFVHGWDDHEVGNNWYWDDETDTPGLPELDVGPARAVEIAANGIQSWVEYMPARVEYDPSRETLQDQFRLWRRFEFGDLVDLAVTDERLFRDGPPCEAIDEADVDCREEEDAGRSMLGERQRSWFEEWIEASDAVWTTWANEVLTMPLTVGDGPNQIEILHDSWDGFQHERQGLMDHVRSVGPRNFVTLTGDLHAASVGHQLEAYGEVDLEFDYEPVGVEFMTPSVTSINAADVVDFPDDWDEKLVSKVARDQNDHLEFLNFHRHGYAVVEFTRDDAAFSVFEVDKDENSADAARSHLATFRTPDGAVELEQVAGEGPTTSADLPDGTYRVSSVAAGERVVDVAEQSDDDGGDVHLWDWHGGDNQRWEFTRNDDGTYRIAAAHSGKVLDVAEASEDDGANVHQWEWHGGANQRWYVVSVLDEEYKLVNAHSGKVLDCRHARAGDSLYQLDWHGGDNQRWSLERL